MERQVSIINTPERYQALSKFVHQHMTKGTDYGVIPGTNTKPTLLKPGAEKLCRLFGLATDTTLVYCVEDFTGKEHGEPLFYYRYRTVLTWRSELIATCEGSCNSWEKKYRYRDEKPTCPRCGVRAIRKSEREFYCWRKIEGCGATFPLSFAEIASQPIGKVPNNEIFDQINTLQKMAQKRSLVGAVLLGTAASEFFTQDLEDI
jgi:hypothetical protein